MKIANLRLLVVLTLVAVISFATVTPVRSGAPITLDLTVTPPCACSTGAIYTFHLDNPADALVGVDVTIPAGYAINPAYLTTTAGIVVATGVAGDWPWPPYTPTHVLEIKTTTTSGVFELFVDGAPVGTTGTYTPPTETTDGKWESMFPAFGDQAWGEISFVAGFIINPCTEGTYSWSPNTAYVGAGRLIVDMEPRTGYSTDVTLVNCAVGGVVAPTNKLEILAPYLALAGLVAAVSTVVIVRRRHEA